MRCKEVRQELPGYIRDGSTSLSMRRHLMGCERCRAELERYQDLLDSMSALRTVTVEPSAELVRALESIPEGAGLTQALRLRAGDLRRHVARNRRTYVGGAALAVGLTGAALWRLRTRRVAAAPA